MRYNSFIIFNDPAKEIGPGDTSLSDPSLVDGYESDGGFRPGGFLKINRTGELDLHQYSGAFSQAAIGVV